MTEPIAIVGMSCRFPGADSPEDLWGLLREKRDAITEVPPDRWDPDEYYASPPAPPGKMCTRWGGFLKRVDGFDAAFFGISDREARFMDPQQRVVMEVAWEALERAGIAAPALAGSNTGVFIGVSNFDYNRLMCRDTATMDAYSSTGTILAITANRLSYLLNLRGPSIAIDTACSSSLVSVHLACQSLRHGESDVALAGGVNLILSPEVTIILSQGGLMSPDGRCKAFDGSANGYVRSEGCGILVLKRYSDARRDGDNILALLRGSAVNQDGATNGLTAPSAAAQQAVIRQALANACARPDQLSYVEAHGSGTRLGDIIETRALRAVLLEGRPANGRCAIGSIKSNIGHAESAAGIAGLMKVALSLQHGAIPANLHLNQLNPHIRFNASPLFIPTELHPWEATSGKRLAGVSSFGIGGTNAHVIVEEGPEQAPPASGHARRQQLLVISAKTPQALGAMAGSYGSFLSGRDETSLADLCFTAGCGRVHFPYRVAVTGRSVEDLREQLSALSGPRLAEGLCPQRVSNWQLPSVAFLFTGGGDGRAGFGRQLYENEPAFRKVFDRCVTAVNEHHRSAAPFPPAEAATGPGGDSAIHPVLRGFALQYALAELWGSWGVRPAAVLGFGVGELVAACVVGVLTLSDAFEIAVALARETEPTTHYTEPTLDRVASRISYSAPRVNMISSVTGGAVETGAVFNMEHWRRLSQGGVEPSRVFEGLRGAGIDMLLEMGPRTNIGELGAEAVAGSTGALLSSLSEDGDNEEQMLECLGELYRRGLEIDWVAFHGRDACRPTLLPTYPFERKRFWFDIA